MESQEEYMSACTCSVCDVLKNSFGSRDFASKKDIVAKGRHIPTLNISLKLKNCVRKFNNQMYIDVEWLAGCCSVQRVYCWPCLLFSKDRNVWSTYGYSDLSNIHKAVKKHSLSENHLQAVISEKTFGKARIDYMVSDQKRVRDAQHNQRVKKNREIMKRYIDAVCYLAKTEQSFRGNYVEFIDVLSKYDGQLRGFLDNATTFSGLSSLIQNDLVESVSYVMLDEIRKEVQRAKFISVMLDEATDVTTQLSSVFRYSLDNKIYERFLGFENVSHDRTAEALYTLVTNLMQKHDCESKIVAQTYDGAAVKAGELNGLQSKIKERYPTALFIHCFAHRLNLVLSQAVGKLAKCKVFFMTLNGISAFFSRSTKRTHALNQEMSMQKIPNLSATYWNFTSDSRLVETVFECKESLIAVFERMRDPDSEWDQESYNSAGGFLSSLTNLNFCFLLNLFASFFPLSDDLFDILQERIHDVGYCIEKVNDFRLALEQKRGEFENIWETTKNYDYIHENEPRFKRQKGNYVKTSFSRLYAEIYDTILNQTNIRLGNLDSLRFLELLHSPSFCGFRKEFPELAFQSLKCNYNNFFDFLSLKSQLRVVYMSEEFKDKTITEILSFIKLNGLEKAYGEVTSLCELILTVPATTASAECSCSALKRIKTYSRNFQGQERLQSLALLSIEKELLQNLQSKPEFYRKVTDHFARKARRIPLNYV